MDDLNVKDDHVWMMTMKTLTMVRDGEEGYPGDVLYNVRYSLDDQGGVRIDFTGVEENNDNDDSQLLCFFQAQ